MEKGVLREIEEKSGQVISACIQCGRCTATCPLSKYMDFPPRATIFFLQIGELEKVFSSRGFWYCASCLSCGVRCPKEIDYYKIADALRQIYLMTNKVEPVVSPDNLKKGIIEEAPQQLFIAAFRKWTK
jgi:heterodisulfide reductase subunit C